MKLKQKSNSNIRKRPASSSNGVPSEPPGPLLRLFDNGSDTSIDPIINKTQNFLRPKTSPVNKPLTTQYRINPLLALLDGCLVNPNSILQQQQQQYPFDSSSFYSSSSIGTASARKLIQHKFANKHKASDLDALYRIALQNQTAYQSVEKKVIEARKLQDKQFALQYRALKGSMRLASLPN